MGHVYEGSLLSVFFFNTNIFVCIVNTWGIHFHKEIYAPTFLETRGSPSIFFLNIYNGVVGREICFHDENKGQQPER